MTCRQLLPLLLALALCAGAVSASQPAEAARPGQELSTAFFDITPNVGERIESIGQDARGTHYLGGEGQTGADAMQEHLKAFFGKLGVTWPEGSYVWLSQSTWKVVVHNTPDNLALMEQLLGSMRAGPYQVEIELQIIAFDYKDIEMFSRKGMIEAESLLRLWREGKGELIAAPRLVTQAGQEATVMGYEDYIYPTEFSLVRWEACLAAAETNDNAVQYLKILKATVEPGGFETREVGPILTITPEVDAGGGMINVTLSPELIFDPEWRDFGQEYADTLGKPRNLRMEQPIFHTHAVATSVLIENGGTVLIGGGSRTRDKQKVIYMFVSAELVGPDGKPLPKLDEASWLRRIPASFSSLPSVNIQSVTAIPSRLDSPPGLSDICP